MTKVIKTTTVGLQRPDLKVIADLIPDGSRVLDLGCGNGRFLRHLQETKNDIDALGVELDETPALFDIIETARKWPIKADNARPETISFMRRRGFNITAAKKWQGSVEDGVEFLKTFDIVIHPRCRHTIDEFNHYSYKIDKQTGDILPLIVYAWTITSRSLLM